MTFKSFCRFALAHHEPVDCPTACYRLGGSWWICARCLGLYPAMFLGLFLEPFFLSGLGQVSRAWIFVLGVTPAWLAWAHDRFRPTSPARRGVATITAIFAGGATGIWLWGHVRDPFHGLFTFFLVLGAALSLAVWFLGRFFNENEGQIPHPPEASPLSDMDDPAGNPPPKL